MIKTFLITLMLMTYPGKRLVLLFHNNEGNELKNKQLEVLDRNKAGIEERDITISTYNIRDAKTEVKQWKIPASTAFTFILIGKDGGEKLRADTVVSVDQLFGTIDAMPMRQREMKERN